jgi:CRISPR-associated protein Csx17
VTLGLDGLRSRPLAGYLSAVGLLRVLGTQLSGEIRGRWDGPVFALEGIDEPNLIRFMLDEYSPTPIVSPWNKEGRPDLNSTTRDLMDAVESSDIPQLALYADVIGRVRTVLATHGWDDLEKLEQIALWRNHAPDGALGWVDAAAVLTGSGPVYPALLGTGGNDGRLEMSRLYLGEVRRLFLDGRASAYRRGWLESLLFARPGPALVDSSSGQFDPVATGGPNTGAQGSAAAVANPWGTLLTFEGVQVFRAGVASRLGVGRQSVAAAPFAVRSSAVGDTSSDAEDVRSEVWVPTWDSPATWRELESLFAEGRLTWRGRQASTAVDARRAIAGLGAARGLCAFERYAFSPRNGKAYVAVAAGSAPVAEVRSIGMLGALDQWLGRVPGEDRAARSVVAARRSVDRALFAAADSEMAPEAVQELLVAFADLEGAIGRSSGARSRCQPIPRTALPAADWVEAASDASPEFALAVGLASLRDGRRGESGPRTASEMDASLFIRRLGGSGPRLEWPDAPEVADPAIRSTRSGQPFVELLRRRLRHAPSVVSLPVDEATRPNVPALRWGASIPGEVVTGLVLGLLDMERVDRLVRGLALLDWSYGQPELRPQRITIHEGAMGDLIAPPWLVLLRQWFEPGPARVGAGGDRRWLVPSRSWGSLIAAGRTAEVVGDAVKRARVAGLAVVDCPPTLSGVSPETVAMALLVHADPVQRPALETTNSQEVS